MYNIGLQKLPWWNKECQRLRNRLQRIRKYIWAHQRYFPNQRAKFTDKDEIQCRRGLKREIQKAKRRNWRSFIGEVNDTPTIARLHRAFNKPVAQEMGQIVNAQGVVCSSEESLRILAATHFPNSRSTPPGGARPPLREYCDVNDPLAAFINVQRMKVVVKAFGDFKGCGPDGICPIAFKHLGENALLHLVYIMRAVYLLGRMPEGWREVRVIFLPKEGKDAYNVPKAWRPISLMNFIPMGAQDPRVSFAIQII